MFKLTLLMVVISTQNVTNVEKNKLSNDEAIQKLSNFETFAAYCNLDTSILYSVKEDCAKVDSASNEVQISSSSQPKIANLGSSFKAVVFKKNGLVFISIEKKGDNGYKIIRRFFWKEVNNKTLLYKVPMDCKFQSEEIIPIVEKCNKFKLKGTEFIKKLVEVDVQVKDKNGQTQETINKKGDELNQNLEESTKKIADGIAECTHKFNEVYNFQIECLLKGVQMDHNKIVAILEKYAEEIKAHFTAQNKNYIVTVDKEKGRVVVTRPTQVVKKVVSSNALV